MHVLTLNERRRLTRTEHCSVSSQIATARNNLRNNHDVLTASRPNVVSAFRIQRAQDKSRFLHTNIRGRRIVVKFEPV
jgi:hypothetical protein